MLRVSICLSWFFFLSKYLSIRINTNRLDFKNSINFFFQGYAFILSVMTNNSLEFEYPSVSNVGYLQCRFAICLPAVILVGCYWILLSSAARTWDSCLSSYWTRAGRQLWIRILLHLEKSSLFCVIWKGKYNQPCIFHVTNFYYFTTDCFLVNYNFSPWKLCRAAIIPEIQKM